MCLSSGRSKLTYLCIVVTKYGTRVNNDCDDVCGFIIVLKCVCVCVCVCTTLLHTSNFEVVDLSQIPTTGGPEDRAKLYKSSKICETTIPHTTTPTSHKLSHTHISHHHTRNDISHILSYPCNVINMCIIR